MHKILVSTAVALTCTAPAMANIVQDAPLVSIASQDAYFNNLRAHCGKAFEGKVVVDNPKSPGFEGRLVMHVRKCSDRQLQIPFHVGDDHSRTWILTRTETGILADCAAELARLAGPGCALVEFGSGSSVKTRLLLDAMPDLAAYVPIDVSRHHLDATAAKLRRDYPRLRVEPVCADYMVLESLPADALPGVWGIHRVACVA